MEKNIIQNKYKLIGVLGKGQFGTVCKGIVLKTQEPVAIKLEPRSMPVISLRHESMVLRHLNNKHVSQIPQLYYYGSQDVYVCLVMTYYKEMSLDCYELELEHVYEWWSQSCNILKSVHEHGVIHRDIKPCHFMKMSGSGSGDDSSVDTWHLIDFGLATTYLDEYNKHVSENETKKETLIGSPNWISLYIHEGKEPTRRDDYISLVYIFMDLCLQTTTTETENGLPWIDLTDGFRVIDSPPNQIMIQQKSWICLKTMIDKSILKEEEKTLFHQIIFLCSQLAFSDKPPYDLISFDF
jgi:serine/threonine protein kinase